MTMKMSPIKKAKAGPRPAAPPGRTGKENFLDAVYAIVRRVPRGRVTTYGAVAEAAGIRLSARMVGWAMDKCGGVRPPVPAHRVVNRQGILSGRHHFATPTLMQELLEQEGVRVEDDQVADFAALFWDPAAPRRKQPPASRGKKTSTKRHA